MSDRAADPDLLFVASALQGGLLSPLQFADACADWRPGRATPLAEILVQRGWLTPATRAELEVRLFATGAQTVTAPVAGEAQPTTSDGPAESSAATAGGAPHLPATIHDDARRPDASTACAGGGPTVATGRFTVLRLHARGGLGQVSLAQDERLHRQVALKEVRPERGNDPQLRQRFLAEAEITGQLQHPGVVPVYALEEGPGGRPYYAMRFVEGRTLSQAIQQYHGRPTPLVFRDLLQRFVALCRTLAFAHSKGVIHRDLKPANIMLGDYGETLVVDWGLAKRLGEPAPGDGMPEGDAGEAHSGAEAKGQTLDYWPAARSSDGLTQSGQVLGTPAYMTPEVAEGRAAEVGPATDVYALGAILYEVLTGQAPYRGESARHVLDAVRRGPPPPPGRLKRGVPRALQAVCLKAMARAIPDRYGSAADLAREIEQWLADEPVAAYPEPLAARLGRWARRHKARVTAGAVALLVALLAGVGAWLWTAQRRAETEQAVGLALGKAEQLREQARRAPAEGPAQAAEALAVWKQALATAEQAEDIGAAGLVGEETAGRAARLLAELRAGMNEAEDALAQSRKDARMLTELEDAHLAYCVSKGDSLDLAAGAATYAKAFAAYGLNVLGNEPAAVVQALRRVPARMREALAVALDDWALCAPTQAGRRRLRAVADAVDYHPWRQRLRRAQDLEALNRLAVQARRQPLPPMSFDLLAIALLRAGARAEAAALLRQAQQRYPADFWINLNLGNTLKESNWQSKQGLEEAIGYFRAAVALRPDNASVHNNLGSALKKHGDLAGAIAEFKKAITLDPKHAVAHNNLGNAWMAKGDVAGAIAEYKNAIGLGPKWAVAHSNLGVALKAQGDMAGAGAEFKRAVALNPKNAPSHYNLGLALLALGDVTGAVAELQKAIALNPRLAVAHCTLGRALQQQGRLTEALASYRRGHGLGASRPGWRYPSAQWVKQAERLVELNGLLPAYLKAERRPQSAAEALEVAGFCQQPYKQLYAAAARFYQDAFAAEPKLAKALRAGHRYNAACAAALAGCGQGKDAAELSAPERSRLHHQAVAWLRADLTAWQNFLEKAPKQTRLTVRETLRNWQKDTDFAGVRSKAALAKLPEEERGEWAKFWGEVAALLEKASLKE
jgi:tetratricopeptide (TPR) repeat protein